MHPGGMLQRSWMTVADPKTLRQRRSWRHRLRAGTDPLTRSSSLLAATSAPWTVRRHKVLDDMADLLHMSTVDPKAPAETPGSADLLEALVRTERPASTASV